MACSGNSSLQDAQNRETNLASNTVWISFATACFSAVLTPSLARFPEQNRRFFLLKIPWVDVYSAYGELRITDIPHKCLVSKGEQLPQTAGILVKSFYIRAPANDMLGNDNTSLQHRLPIVTFAGALKANERSRLKSQENDRKLIIVKLLIYGLRGVVFYMKIPMSSKTLRHSWTILPVMVKILRA